MSCNDIYRKHFSENHSPDILKYAKDVAFKNYIFVRIKGNGKGRRHAGYCAYCEREFAVSGLKHKTDSVCPLCKKNATVIMTWYGRSRMIDEAYFVYYEKSLINPKVLVARGIYAIRDFRDDYKNAQICMKDRALYIFEMGKSTMFKRYTWYTTSEGKNRIQAGTYNQCKKVYSEFNQYYSNADIFLDYSRDSIAKAVKGTPFQYSTWENYKYSDMTRFFDLYSKYPCIEYITKIGFEKCVEDKLSERPTYGAINWNGKTLEKVFRLSRNEFKSLKSQNLIIDSYFLKLYQLSCRDGSALSGIEVNEIENAFGYGGRYKDIVFVRQYSSLRKVFNYIRRQYQLSNESKKNWFYSIINVLTDYRDYLKDCITLGMDMNSESVLFPKNLHRAHQNTTKQIKVKEDETLNLKITKRLEALNQKYAFEFGGLFIRPAESSIELINEGKALNHCVGTYAQRYADGQTNILLIRKISQPNKPFFTMEISKEGHIIQTRGKGNCAVTGEVADFVEAFRCKLSENKKEKQIRIMVPA